MCYNKKVMISIDDLTLADIDYQAKLNGLSRSAYIRFAVSRYHFFTSSDYEYDYTNKTLSKVLK